MKRQKKTGIICSTRTPLNYGQTVDILEETYDNSYIPYWYHYRVKAHGSKNQVWVDETDIILSESV